jgi:hypothetical protein
MICIPATCVGIPMRHRVKTLDSSQEYMCGICEHSKQHNNFQWRCIVWRKTVFQLIPLDTQQEVLEVIVRANREIVSLADGTGH